LGTGFYGSNDPTNSVKALKEGPGLYSPKDQAPIPPGPPHHVTVLRMHAIYIDNNESKHSEMVPVRQNPNPRVNYRMHRPIARTYPRDL